MLFRSAQDYYNDIFRSAHYEKEHIEDRKSAADDFLVRKMELVNKIALIDCISDGKFEVNINHLKYAEKVFNFSLSCIKEYVPMILGSDYGKMRQKVLDYIKYKRKCKMNHISNNFRDLTLQDKNKVLMDLKISGSIAEHVEPAEGKGRGATWFVFLEDIKP